VNILRFKFSVSNWAACATLALGLKANAQTNPAVYPIDLPTVLKLAGAQNLDVQIAREKLAEALAGKDIAAAKIFPWFAPGISYKRHDGHIQDVTGNIFDTSKQAYALGGTLNAQVELGEAYYQSLAAKQTVIASRDGLEAQRFESVAGAAQGYFELLKAQAAVGVAREALTIAEDYAQQLQDAVKAGIAFKGDALRARGQAERNQLTLRQTQEQQRLAAARLAQILHLNPVIELAPQETDFVPVSLTPTNAALDSLVAKALATRPEIKQGEAYFAAAKNAKDGVTYGPLVPGIGAQVFLGGLGGGRNRSVGNFGDAEDYYLGLGWRIGPGGLFDHGRVRLSNSRLRGVQLTNEKLHDEIVRQVVEAHTRLQSSGDQLATAKRALVIAEETLRLTNERKEFAVGVVLENIQAQQDFTRARNDYLGILADYNKAQYGLALATGSLIPAK